MLLVMSDWNEETLRKAASWKAFKEGQALLRDGGVTDAIRTATGWSGAVRSGKKTMRVGVTARSATDLEARCPCPENQGSGVVCSHAVATGLALLRGRNEKNHVPEAPRPKPETGPLDIVFGPNWQGALARGKLAFSIAPGERSATRDADSRLHAFLTAAGVAVIKETHLQIAGSQLAGFLNAICGHPAVTARSDGRSIMITNGDRLPLADVVREDEEIHFLPDPAAGPWHLIGDALVQAAGDGIHLAGSAPLPESLRPCVEALVSGNPLARLPLRRFLDSLPVWQEWLEFPTSGWLAGIHFVPATPRIHLNLDGSLKELHASLTVAYPDANPVPPGGGDIPSLPQLKGDRCEIRNPAAEANACRIMQDAGFTPHSGQGDSWNLSGEAAILPFLAKIMPGLRNKWTIEESPSIRRTLERILIVSPKIDVIGSGDDWLDFRLHYQTDDGRILPDAEIRSLIRSGNQHRKLPGDRHLWVDEHSAGLLESLIEDIDLQQQGGHYSAKNCAAELIKNFQNNDHKSLNLNNQHSKNNFQNPATLLATLRPYQSQGSAWLADRVQRYGGALLADDMGLGKTIQTIALIEHLQQTEGPGEGPVLVIATTSLLGNWQAEFARFAPGRRVRVIHGTGRESARDAAKPGDVLITSYGTLARDLAWHLRQHYQLVVADEASLMRNPDTDYAKAAAKLRADYRIALTGTPVENSVRDLWSIFRFIQPGWLGSREHFRERYELPLAQPGTSSQSLRVLQLKTSPFVLRRTKQEVAPELPGKLEIDEFCDLSRDQWGVYREILAEGRRQVEALSDQRLTGPARMRILTVLLRLRQTCCDLALLQNDRLNKLSVPRRSAKLERLMILLEEAREGGHRTLVFSQFSKQLQEIEKCVQAAGLRHLRLDGQTRNRQELVDRFQDPSGPEVFLISLKAGGYGLNLTAADTVIHFDPWWNPAVEAQATDRAHRIGQTRPVTVYRLLTRGTVEEKVLRLQSAKREMARAIDEAGGGDPPAGLLDDPRRLQELFEA